MFLSKNVAKIANTLPNFSKLAKKNQKSLFLAGFFSFNAVSFNSD
jgi:hypothetical protein